MDAEGEATTEATTETTEATTEATSQEQNAEPRYPDLSDIVREGPDAGPGTPEADGDRAHKALTLPSSPLSIDGVVPTRDLLLQHQREHPELVEDLKTALGLKQQATATQPEQEQPPASTVVTVESAADPYHTKPPQPACAAEAMSAYDGQGPGSEPEPQAAGDADAPTSVLDCASPGILLAAVAGPSRHDHDAADGDLRHGAHTAPCEHGSGATSVEDKCLECCVYYGVMCCQCTIS